jgi:hypothetical protein
MTTGLRSFRRIQIGKETARGTAVAADTKLIGRMELQPDLSILMHEDERNSLALHYRDDVVRHEAGYRFTGAANYEQILQFLAMTLRGGISGVQQGGSAAYDWTFTPTLNAVNTQDAFTIEYGDNLQEWESAFAVCRSLELSIVFGDALGITADILARFPEKATFTGSLLDPSVLTTIKSDSVRLYIDANWAGLGGTEFNTMLVGGSIRLNSGLVPVRFGDGLDANGRANFSTVIENPRASSFDLDMALSASAITQVYDAFVARTSKAIRLAFSEPVDSIQASYKHEMNIDMFGRFTALNPLFQEVDGMDVFRVTFTSYDDALATPGNELSVRVRTTITDI